MATGSGENDKAISSKAEKPTPVDQRGHQRQSRRARPAGSATCPKGGGAAHGAVARGRIKYYTGPAEQKPAPSSSELPNEYGEDRITILVRDPYVAYAYWGSLSRQSRKGKILVRLGQQAGGADL